MTAQKEHANFFEVILYHVIHLVSLWLNDIGYCCVADTGLCLYSFTPYLRHKEAYSHYS